MRGTSLRPARPDWSWQRLSEDDGFESVPVVIGLVVAAAALGTAIAGLDWTAAATSFQTAITTAYDSVGGGGGGGGG
ncbi:MAG: hypothetical protein ACFCVF_10215 [Kineosporiaceae bacterium]